MTTAKLLSRVPTGERARIVCGIGHVVTADVFTATYQHSDMDGEPMAPWSTEEYEPASCVVCGLKLWARADINATNEGSKFPPLGARIENA